MVVFSDGVGGGRNGDLLTNGYRMSVPQRERGSGNGLHNSVNVHNRGDLAEKYYKPIIVQFYTANCVS